MAIFAESRTAVEASRMPAPAEISGAHIAALDGIRGLAILLVLIFHYGRSARSFGMSHPLLSASEFGWCGVDLFFVLSGFLITGILYDSRQSTGYFRNFYARRVLRIFPLYYTALLFIVVLSAVWTDAGIWGTSSPAWIALYLTNFVMAAEGPPAAGILAHYWSLAIEEHFYLVWPLLVLWGTRRQLMVAAFVLVVSALALRTAFVIGGASSDAVYFLTPLRMDALATGAFISLAVRGPSGVSGLIRPAWTAMAVCATAVLATIGARGTVSASDPVMQSIGYTLIACGFGGALLTGLSWRPANLILSSGVLRWFGRYSYGMYVWHPIVNVILFSTAIKTALGVDGPLSNTAYLLVAFATVIIVSLASFHGLEQPFLRLKKHFSSARAK